MPALLPADYFKETGRWDLYGDVLLRLRDRKGGDYHLGPTHEEIVTDIARREMKSWRDLPKTLYQVQMKFRDEPRPRGGLLRGREFIMKDAYSFDADEKGAAESYEMMRQAYVRIFDRMGLTYRMVQADSGAIGGSTSAEFQVLVDSGEDAIVACENCDYAANVEAAEPLGGQGPRGGRRPASRERVSTPDAADDRRGRRVPRRRQEADAQVAPLQGQGRAAGERGRHGRGARRPRAQRVRAGARAQDDRGLPRERRGRGARDEGEGRLRRARGLRRRAPLRRPRRGRRGRRRGGRERDRLRTSRTCGSRATTAGEVGSLRQVDAGDRCPRCGGRLQSYRGIEAGHIFILGTKYSEPMGATFVDEKQQQRPLVMGCYGIGVSRLVATTIEQHHDDNGIRWPMSVAPYHVHLVTLGKDEGVVAAARALYDALGPRRRRGPLGRPRRAPGREVQGRGPHRDSLARDHRRQGPRGRSHRAEGADRGRPEEGGAGGAGAGRRHPRRARAGREGGPRRGPSPGAGAA